MELSLTTFVLEIINFLVLVWILKRFLYRPVLDLVDRRRAMVEQTLADAENAKREAKALEQRYEGRLAEWDREKRRDREQLTAALDAERTRRLAALEAELEEARERDRQAAARQRADEALRIEREALRNGATFAARLLRDTAGPELEARLADRFIDELEALSPEQRAALRGEGGPRVTAVAVHSAYPLDEARRTRLRAAVADLAAEDADLEFSRDGALLAGLSLALGDQVLALNLRDELRGFADVAASREETDGEPA